jgi:t-SNARE complex subunit (syntaxin)
MSSSWSSVEGGGGVEEGAERMNANNSSRRSGKRMYAFLGLIVVVLVVAVAVVYGKKVGR